MKLPKTIKRFVVGVSLLMAVSVNFPIIFLKMPHFNQTSMAFVDVGIQITVSWFFAISFTIVLYLHENIGQKRAFGWLFLCFIGYLLVLSALNVLVVKLPFYTSITVVMRGIIMVLMAYFISIFLKENDRKNALLVKYEQLKHENVLMQLNALKNQLNPHFLFNSLNTLSWLISHDTAQSQQFLQKLSHILRYSLSRQDKSLVTLAEEMRLIEDYIFLLNMRFGTNLTIELPAITGFTHWKIPPLSIQLLLENAIKHNVISAAHPLLVQVLLAPDKPCLVVKNTLQPRGHSVGEGIGLVNLNERFLILCNQAITIEQNQFFTVSLPLIP